MDKKACYKKPHKTEKRARKAMTQLKASKKNKRKRFGKVKIKASVYFCKICDAWHWGHR